MMLTLGQFVLWASLRCNTCKMKPRKQHVLLLWILLSSTVIKETEPFSSFKFPNIKETWNSIWGESCNSYWISFNQTGLKADLGNKLFGQHIASNTIFKSVSGFMKDNNPKKPLVLSLHGPTGTGKNFVSQLIADNVYKKGYHSKFVHVFSATHHFPHRSEIVTYKSQLQESIKNSVTNCERSMFIFDEMDKIPPGVIDSIKPYLDYGKVEGVFFQRSIIIFLSNTGADQITKTAVDFWKNGKDREEMMLKDFESFISPIVFNSDQSGFSKSTFIDSCLVDVFIPFLPLEYKHVVQCAMAAMRDKGLQPDENVADQVARSLVYYPKLEQVFSVSGCKTVANRVHLYR
ncbi:torsin-1A-like isoform X1 [Maylandia zebra]|uniref:torsin-1A-like isoform X1 n=1 Tax=Maylandia zebra TaxID=106582 RepID=UPI00403CAC73